MGVKLFSVSQYQYKFIDCHKTDTCFSFSLKFLMWVEEDEQKLSIFTFPANDKIYK